MNDKNISLVAISGSVIRCRIEVGGTASIGDRLYKSTVSDGSVSKNEHFELYAISLQNVLNAGNNVFIQCLLK